MGGQKVVLMSSNTSVTDTTLALQTLSPVSRAGISFTVPQSCLSKIKCKADQFIESTAKRQSEANMVCNNRDLAHIKYVKRKSVFTPKIASLPSGNHKNTMPSRNLDTTVNF